jgi:hypothetical protein
MLMLSGAFYHLFIYMLGSFLHWSGIIWSRDSYRIRFSNILLMIGKRTKKKSSVSLSSVDSKNPAMGARHQAAGVCDT